MRFLRKGTDNWLSSEFTLIINCIGLLITIYYVRILSVLTNVLGAGIEMQCGRPMLVVLGAPFLRVPNEVRAQLV